MQPRASSSRSSSSPASRRASFPHSRALDDERQLEEERRLAYVGITRAKRRLFLSHAWRRATWGASGASVPSRFLLEIPDELMEGPRLRSDDEHAEGPLDLELVFGARRSSRFGTPIRAGGGAYRQGSGRPGAPAAGTPFAPTRDLAAKRSSYAGGARSGELAPARGRGIPAWDDATDGEPDLEAADELPVRRFEAPAAVIPARPIVPGERRYRDGDRVRHARFGDGIVVSARLTRDDEEVTVAFRDGAVGRKTMLASLANLELIG